MPVIVPPMIEPGSGVVIEGDVGTTTVNVAVGLSYPSDETVTVDWATADVLDQPELGVDYEAASGTVTFLPGETSATVPITVIGDELDENFAVGAEWIPVAFTNATNATIPTGFLANFGFGLIADDDPPPEIIPGSGFGAEGAGGLTAVDLTIDLSAPSGQTVSVDWATIDNLGSPPASSPPGYTPPVAGVDFESASGTVTFAPGETSKTVSVDIIGDTTDEVGWIFDAEWGAIVLSAPTNATLVPGFLNNVGFFLIVDDDP